MGAFDWDPVLETGHEDIDEQHKMLFELAGRLAEAIEIDETDEDAIADAIYGLTDYVIEHFADEEALMEGCGYPGLGMHRGLHQNLTGDTMALAAQYFNGELPAGEKIASFVTGWLVDHIGKNDREVVAYLRAQQG